jgi:antitoxin component HigA of HigAB toxin-antitoxin module
MNPLTHSLSLSHLQFEDLPKTYQDLCHIHMPRTLHDKADLRAATKIIDLMAGQKLNGDQEDYLTTLAELVSVYEENTVEPLSKLPPHDLLAAHLRNIGMSATAWGNLIGVDRSTASRLLRGERKLNTSHIRKTADSLHIDAGLLV